MNNSPLASLSYAAALYLAILPASSMFAQTTVVPAPTVTNVPTQTQTTVTTTVPVQPTPAPLQTQTIETTTVTNVPLQTPVVPTQPGQHVAELEIVVSRGNVQAYFGRAPRGEKFDIGNAQLRIKLPSTATVTKLASRDKTSDGPDKVTVDNPWHVMVPFSEPGRYVFNIVDWDDDARVVLAVVKVDGVVKFEGHGADDDFKNWPSAFYGEGVHRTGSREIAFDVE